MENSYGQNQELNNDQIQGPDVRRHMTEDILDDGKRYFVCNFCGKTCPLKATVIRHIKTVHSESYQLKCDVCGRTYKNEPSFPRLQKEDFAPHKKFHKLVAPHDNPILMKHTWNWVF